MADHLLEKVMSPEGGIEKTAGGPPGAIGAAPSGRGDLPQRRAGSTMMAPDKPPAVIFAGRLDTLENKTLYLVDIGFGGGYKFMQQLQKWFMSNMPSVTTILKRKPGNVFMDDKNELWEEIKAKGQAVVLGVAG